MQRCGVVRPVPVTDSPEDPESDLSEDPACVPALLPSDDAADPDELVVDLPGGRVMVFMADNATRRIRWARRLVEPTAAEVMALLQQLDPAARAVIEAKRLTGSLVELHPADREMFEQGFKAIAEEGGWLQANFRDRGQVTRVMRIRPATGVAVISTGALMLAALAAQSQAAEMAEDIKAIGHRVDQIYGHLQDDQVGAVGHAVTQVNDLVGMLRAHGTDGVSDSDLAVVGNALGDARAKCLQHLRSAVSRLEQADRGSAANAAHEVTERAVDEVLLYLDLMEQMQAATVQFGVTQVAYDWHAGRPQVARTRAEQTAKLVETLERDMAGVRGRLARLHDSRAQLPPWWKVVGKGLLPAGLGAGGAAVLAYGPGVADAIGPSDDSKKRDDKDQEAPGAVKVGAVVVGFGVGLVVGGKEAVKELRARKPVAARLDRLAAAGSRTLDAPRDAVTVLGWLRVASAELDEAVARRTPLPEDGTT